ncbi:TetR/AcrR family transcriptional regulator [Haloferax namakaokahaiae]|uniref:TetR/AcrR family transcriptional regulator n=1 Tax=Haloferax namakaokahaiae TaxID=1748331 RepID=A0ABD5ZD97_9EURY
MVSEPSTEIMEATYHALCEHGYANLTMQRIADESSVTKAALHYHFDTKQELLNAFLGYLIDQFEARLACDASDPRERLTTFLDAIFSTASDRDTDFAIALMGIKAQAPYQSQYRERLEEVDETMQSVVKDAVADGIESGLFDDVEPDTVAHTVVTLVNGSRVREVTLGEEPNEARSLVEAYLELELGWSPEGEA